MSKDCNKIDFVILWVDGNDKKWLNEKSKYVPVEQVANSSIRFREWGNLKYWFRAVEKYTPWVNKIYFVTYGHLPKFLNVNHPKIEIVKHESFISKEYLPTYNSNVLDLNICNIKGLNERFVYFNDDTFITDYMSQQDFFKDGLPCDDYGESPILPYGTIFPYTMMNNLSIINKYYNKRDIYTKRLFKYINLKYGINNIRTITSLPFKKFIGFYNAHLPISFLKSYCEKLWDIEKLECEKTSRNRFRTKEDITLYLAKQFQLLDGNFFPRKSNIGKMFVVSDDNSKIVSSIKNHRYKMICINDQDENIDFLKSKEEINGAFDKLLPDKSSFEL